ncbi:vancomycin resistance histidine kinase VanS [Anaerosacchariphilus polymeriproducens]|uniref:histidine kinase n=2 Tax=Anaerosacchariphilus polymeriproducens TaxID=1812858 RepID=A0A371AZQ3_9FIRM|nr:vancomycin resistance histidine kinase VanS [Anaerosacchariphilus polymeriproducens]
MIGGYLLVWYICSRYIWYETNRLYNILKAIQTLFPLIFFIIIIIGSILLTRRMLLKSLRHMDEVIEAAKKLSHPDERPIKLSQDMIDVQNELNLAREQGLRNILAAKEAEQRKNDLIVYLAHDLKTPLTSVIGYLTLLRDEPQISSDLRTKYTGIALDKAERLEDLLNEFFDITRFNLTTLTLEPERTNLSRMLEQITYEFNPILAEKELKWNMEITSDVEVLCDSDKLERVFDNLIRNAVNYSYAGTEITLSMKPVDDGVRIVVGNNGKTIPPDKLNRIFEQFFRLDSARSTSTGGSGLGLAISKELVELHGGQIQAVSEDESIIFTVWIPMDCHKIV